MKEYPMEFAEGYLCAPNELVRMGGLWLIRAGRNVAKPHYRSGPRTMTEYSLHFLLRGSVYVENGEAQRRAAAGDVFCLFPGTSCRYWRASEEPLEMIWVAFNGPQALTLLALAGLDRREPVARAVLGEELLGTLHLLLRRRPDSAADQMETCGALYRMFGQMLTGCREEAGGREPGPADWVGRGLAFMNARYTEPIQVQDVADHVGLNRSYFSRLFTGQVGMAPSRYLNKLRMERAASLLREGPRRPVVHLATALGYQDVYAFTRAFRNHYGVPPGEYRRRLRMASAGN
ncbi:AraC family transcriptional regulator [Paenibacillus sp. J31TS4]|uniref:AraC family transcriptional regulator n=1 Tax=Paenibacillus sp. J31TS4 TaxID=2807195 RepID=UPI001AFF6D03|nr:AraC family transcriptional regulator [Paenibacillus sp. J31TS4]GIP40424.1 AraC family transcriptional regulator [Paenibacillus sp. J31TS4]